MDGEGIALATTIATAVATSVSLLVSLWWRWADRKEPDWITYDARAKFGNDAYGDFEDPHVTCLLANVGDATAYRVKVRGYGCKAELGRKPMTSAVSRDEVELVSSIEPGNEVRLTVWATPDRWNGGFVVVTWVVSPTRRRRSRRSERLSLMQVADPPSYSEVRSGKLNKQTGQIPQTTITEVPADFVLSTSLAPDRDIPAGGLSWWQERIEERLTRKQAADRK